MTETMIPTYAPLDAVFGAESIAFVGASDRPRSWGYVTVKRFLDSGYRGRIIPINPRLDRLLGLEVYPSLLAAPGPIDLAVLMIGPARIPEVVEEAAQAGVKAILAQPGGFAEEGETGRELEDRIARIVDAYGIRFLGPNTAGLSDTTTSVNTYFHARPQPGRLALVFQGGGVGTYMCEVARRRAFGVSKVISLGNQLRTDLIDCVEYLKDDDRTSAAAIQVEGAPRSSRGYFMRELVASLAELKERKGLAVFHTGRYPTSAGLTYSHTSSMATPRELFEGACRQYGICLAETAADAVVLAHMMEGDVLKTGLRVAIVGSGSQSMYLADLCDQTGLAMPALEDEIADAVAGILRRQVTIRNPLDLGIQNLPVLGQVVTTLAASPRYDAVVYGLPSSEQTEVVQSAEVDVLWSELAAASDVSSKPVVGVEWFGPPDRELRARLECGGHVLTDTPEEAIRIVSALGRSGLRAGAEA